MTEAHVSPILEIVSPQGQISRHDRLRSPMIIGRLPDCDIQLDSQRVSRRHAELILNEDQNWILRDLGSRNHTRINGKPITEQILEDSDLIEIGQFKLRIVWPEDDVSDTADEDDSQTTHWSAEESDAADFQTLRSSPPQRLSASHLAQVNSLSQRLLQISDPRQRLIEVCLVLIGPGMSCDSAVAVRIASDSATPPQLLCAYQLRVGKDQPPGISRAVVEAAVSTQQPVLAGGAISSGLTVNFSEAERGITAIIACPLHLEPNSADILYATVPFSCGTLDWLALVTLAAEQYKKAELQIEARRTTQDNATLQHELKRARKIQMSLVPKSPTAAGLEVAIGFEPCLWIGGDYANVLAAPGGRVCLIVADVSGKGLPAAMIATGVHSVVDASIRQGKSLSEMAQDLNRFLIGSMDRQSHLTALAVLFDPQTGQIEYLNAGHPPILISNSQGQVRELSYGHNPPLGVLPTLPSIDTAVLNPGDVLFLYTDGLTEMSDAAGKMLGLEGVESQFASLYAAAGADLPLSQLRNQLSQSLDTLRGSSPVTDDRTFLFARRI